MTTTPLLGLVAIALLLLVPAGRAEDTPAVPPELGAVSWHRDLDRGLASAQESGRPVLLLFQEIPGCAGCVSFGQQPLSHPLLVEAIEECFVPVAIYNNKPGRDAEILKRFDEPSWNYPVMRFLDASGADVLPRRDEIFTTEAVATRLAAALTAAGRPVPAYLRLAAEEARAEGRGSVTFAMHCYWEGEARIGTLDGVLGTRAGWVDGREVVEVEYDEDRLAFATLVEAARRADCCDHVYTHTPQQATALAERSDASALPARARDAKADDRKFALNRSPMRLLPLTPMQATKVNAALRLGKDPSAWITPRQAALLERVQKQLARDAESLEGLERPAAIDDLLDYERDLRRRLAKAERLATAG